MKLWEENVGIAMTGVIVASIYFLPEHLSDLFSLWLPGIEYIASGFETCGLWIFVSVVALFFNSSRLAVVCLWPAYESGLKVVCRLAFPMSKPVFLPHNTTMCSAAYGEWTSWIGICLAFLIVAFIAKGTSNGRARTDG